MTDNVSSKVLLAVAVEAARTAGKHAFDNLHRNGETIMRTAHDVKLALDVECQQIATKVILDRFPTHAILGEEDVTGVVDAIENIDQLAEERQYGYRFAAGAGSVEDKVPVAARSAATTAAQLPR